jgi:Pyruvate/2-oxoacid:ferredoxin oxidoreductase delta subunit
MSDKREQKHQAAEAQYPLDAASTTHGPMYPLGEAEAAAARPPERPPLEELAVETPPSPLDEPTRRALAAATGSPEFMVPWLDRFYDPAEAGLVLAVANRALGAAALDQRTLDRAVRRAVLDRDPSGLLTPSSFHARFEMWSFFEGWLDLSADVRRELNEWELAYYIDQIGPGVRAVRDGRSDGDQGDYTFLLLHEAEELLRGAPHVYLWPCNCRAMWGNCSKERNVCLRFDNARNVGWELNADHAVAVLREADRHGLMHTAYLGSRHGHHGICNCCSDCCFPLVSAERLGAAGQWPVRRHLAVVDPSLCEGCGRCTKRCPFGAITRPGGRASTAVVDQHECRGCGLCATGCANGALAMAPLARPAEHVAGRDAASEM